MRCSRLARLVLTPTLAIAFAAGLAQAQSVITVDSGWALSPAGGDVPAPYSFFLRVGGANDPANNPFQANSFSTNPFNLSRTRLFGGATNNNHNQTDEFSYGLTLLRTFTLGEDATVFLPAMVNGRINLAGTGGTNLVSGTIRGELELLRETGVGSNTYATTGFTTGFTHSLTGADLPGGAGTQLMQSVWDADSFDAAGGARRYRVQMHMRVSGIAGLANDIIPLGAAVTVDATADQPRGGAMGSLAAIPQAFNLNSRAAVHAPEARNFFNVDGTGVSVGIIETGEIYNNHSAIDAARITYDRGAAPVADFRREHALFVASIIGATGGNTSDRGVAPGVTFRSAPLNSYNNSIAAMDNVIAGGSTVINMSAGADAFTPDAVDSRIIANPRVTFVTSSGNDGRNQNPTGNTATNPSLAWNIITVGALNRDFTRRAEFSSFNGTNVLNVPTLMAPGEYINGASLAFTNGDTAANSFARVFMGNDFDHAGGAATGDVSGTSFSAPHVAGAIALMNHYAARNNANFDADSIDHRVMKAVAVNSASTNIQRTNQNGSAGPNWAQDTNGGAATPASPLVVRRSLDPQLGGGALDTFTALRTFAAGEVRQQDDNAARTFTIDASSKVSGQSMLAPSNYNHSFTAFWDLERVGAATAAGNGVVDYLLGDITGGHLRSTLTWDRVVAPEALARLELRLYLEGANMGNMPGLDAGDILLAQTVDTFNTENVKLFDFRVPEAPNNSSRRYFLEVLNPSVLLTTYAIVVQVPTPAGTALLVLCGLITVRRRRA